MKQKYTSIILTAIAAVFFSIFSCKEAIAQPFASVSFDVFYDELSPYGYWDRDPGYGDIWFPRVEQNFRPYGTNGYWAMTEYGNTWVSNYDWGWAPFHYGRWVYTSHRGWGWIPGYEWGPAWVEWRSGADYYGWAPMGPGIGVSVSVGIPLNFWVFLPARRIYDPYMHRYWSYGNRSIYNRTTIIHNTYIVNNNRYYGGPARRDIERRLGRSVVIRNIRPADRPGRAQVDSRSVSLYRPDRSSVRTDNRSQLRENNNRSNNNVGNNTRPQASETRKNERQTGNTPNRSNRITSEDGRQVLRIPSNNTERANRSTERNTMPRRETPTAQQSRGSSQPERNNGTPQRPSQQRQSAPSQQRQSTPSQRVYQASSSSSSSRPVQQQRSSVVERSSQSSARTQAPSSSSRERSHSSGRGSR